MYPELWEVAPGKFDRIVECPESKGEGLILNTRRYGITLNCLHHLGKIELLNLNPISVYKDIGVFIV